MGKQLYETYSTSKKGKRITIQRQAVKIMERVVAARLRRGRTVVSLDAINNLSLSPIEINEEEIEKEFEKVDCIIDSLNLNEI